MNKIFCILLVALVFFNCKKKKSIDYVKKDEEIITKYIADNKLNAKPTGSGLYYVITKEGAGIQPSPTSSVTVNYKGYLTNGGVFDKNSGVSFSLDGVIKGWQEGIPYFKEGGSGILLIPSALGYGSQAQADIPANSVLIFEIDLLDVK